MRPLASVTMRSLLLFGIVTVGSSAAAQDPAEMFAPAKEVAKLDVALGSWESSGTAQPAAGAPAMKWTARSTVKKVLGGHFLRDDLRVDFEAEGIPPFLMRSFYGWDRERKRYVSIALSNEGEVNLSDLHIVDGAWVVLVGPTIENGVPAFARSVTRYDGDSFTFRVEHAMGTEPMKVIVEGHGKRTENGYELSAEDRKLSLLPPIETMSRLAKSAGRYGLKGSYIPAPGAPPMEISGKESVEVIFGGNVMTHHVVGDAAPGSEYSYEGWGHVAWDGANECYVSCWIDNMGSVGRGRTDLVDGELVTTAAWVFGGAPLVERTRVIYGKDGAIREVESHRITGVSQPEVNFQATYERLK